jgi:hypothetical protein
MMANERVEVWLHVFLTWALDERERPGSLQSRSGVCVEEKNVLSLLGIEPRILGRLARSQSLCWLSYPSSYSQIQGVPFKRKPPKKQSFSTLQESNKKPFPWVMDSSNLPHDTRVIVTLVARLLLSPVAQKLCRCEQDAFTSRTDVHSRTLLGPQSVYSCSCSIWQCIPWRGSTE